ncbi:MAG TPA: TetR/AcrR family transcriptional regulator [Terriglobia bacterium]|nr:TetR/AcrR family transcriptional regulator [Terriglobia bacterium]
MAMPRHTHGNGRSAPPARAARASEARDRKLDAILRQAAAVFRTRGYHQASIRDIARATGISLAGLYYYFSSKEELLYLIQRHAFETILESARAGMAGLEDPEERLRSLIRRHLEFFLEHPNEMKVLTHEEEWLGRERGREVRAIKRSYYQLCFEQVEALKRERHLAQLNTRLAVLSLFGMMNWIYTWYNPKVDPGAAACAGTMADIFLRGILGAEQPGGLNDAALAIARADRSNSGGPRPTNGGSVHEPRVSRSGARASQN